VQIAMDDANTTFSQASRLSICIMGTPVSSGNRGVLALGASLLSLCAEAAPEAELVLALNHDRHQTTRFRVAGVPRDISVVPARLSPVSALKDHLAWICFLAVIWRVVPLQSIRRWIRRSSPWIQTLERASWVGDVRGGDSFSDIYGMGRFVLGFVLAFVVLLVKGSIVQFPQTYGPYRNPIARWMARYLLKRSSVILARDCESGRVAEELVGPQHEVWTSPDVAFCLEAVAPESIQLDPPVSSAGEALFPRDDLMGDGEFGVGGRVCNPRHPRSDHLVSFTHSQPRTSAILGININGLIYSGGYTRENMFGLKLDYVRFLPELLNALLQEHVGDLWLVPHTYGSPESVESDPEACRRVRTAVPGGMRERVRVVTGEYDCHEIKAVIGKCDFFIGSRMHACIAALSQGIPCVGVAYSRKFAGVFESVGMEDWVVDGRTTSNDAAVTRVIELYRQRDNVRAGLGQRAAQVRKELSAVFRRLMQIVIRGSRGISTPTC